MVANTTPIFTLTPNTGEMNCLVSTAMAAADAMDGTSSVGTAFALAFTAGADGSRIDEITVRYAATNGSTASGTFAASVIRLWLNNGSDNTTATNNQLLGEIAVPAQTVTALSTQITQPQVLPIELNIPAGYRIYAGSTVAAGGSLAWQVSIAGGDY